jgi:hypothetical protein
MFNLVIARSVATLVFLIWFTAAAQAANFERRDVTFLSQGVRETLNK